LLVRASPTVDRQFSSSRACALWVCLALVALVFVPYAQVAKHEFIVCDDDDYVTANPHVQAGLTLAGVRWAFSTFHASNWHPVTWLSHMLDCQRFGLDPGPHHLVNVGFHAANAVLLFLALRMMTGALWRSAAVAVLFAIHPLRVESVAWVSERKDVLAGFFWMLTLLSYAWYVRRPRAGRYALVITSLAVGLLCKQMLVTLPFVLLLLDVWPLGRARLPRMTIRSDGESQRSWRSLVLEKLPLLAVAIVMSVIAILSQGSSGALRRMEEVNIASRLANAMVSYFAYLWQAVWPFGLAPFYPHQAIVSSDLLVDLYLPAVGSALVLIALTLVLLRTTPRCPWLGIGWLWYLGTLVPVIGLFQIGVQSRADRYTYLPMIGIGIAVVWSVGDWMERKPAIRNAVIGTAAVIGAGYLALTWEQVALWRNDVILFEHAIRVTQKNYFAYNQLGTAHHKRRDTVHAGESFANAVKILPNYDFGNNNLGVYLMARGEYEQARECFERALRVNASFDSVYNLGLLYRTQKRYAEALPFAERAVQMDPVHAGARGQLAMVYAELGRDADAEREYRVALTVDPLDPTNARKLGEFYAARGRLVEAATWLEQSLRVDAGSADAWNSLGVVRAQQGDKARGIAHLEQALRIAPAHENARRNLEILRTP
jgi:protein O-mannosyl-transferase